MVCVRDMLLAGLCVAWGVKSRRWEGLHPRRRLIGATYMEATAKYRLKLKSSQGYWKREHCQKVAKKCEIFFSHRYFSFTGILQCVVRGTRIQEKATFLLCMRT